MSRLKILGISLLSILLLLIVAFGYQVSVYYRSIKAGEPNPITRERIRFSLDQAMADQAAQIRVGSAPVIEDPTAPAIGSEQPSVTIVEFLDYGCPYCRSSFEPVRELVSQKKDTVRLIARDFPVDELHPGATKAAISARCAFEQGRFWQYHDKLFLNQKDFYDEDLLRYAREVGLDIPLYQACIKSPKAATHVANDLQAALRAGVQGTPTFFFNGVKIEGGLNREDLNLLIDEFARRAQTQY